MLGRLARWLRLAGFDTAYDPGLDDASLAGLARGELRWLLTRDRALAARAGPRVLLVRAAAVAEQAGEVLDRLGVRLDERYYFTRCSRCNGELREVAREAVADLVPPYVAVHAPRFSRCSRCNHVYWPGTHHARIEANLVAWRRRGASGDTPSE